MEIYVVAHKAFARPAGLPAVYRTLQVGTGPAVEPGGLRDDTGDTIADKNAEYNEMTALYWIWKNSSEDIVGLCHYRRYFVTPGGKVQNLFGGQAGGFLQEAAIRKLLEGHDMIVHNPTFFMQGVRRQFEETQSAENLAVLEQVLREEQPEYLDAFERVMAGRTIHLLNMFIAKKETADRYAAWLFPLLFETERRLREQNGQADQTRAMGMLAERMQDVWLRANRLRVYECFTLNTERIDRTPW